MNNRWSHTFEPLTPGACIFAGEPDRAHCHSCSHSTSPLLCFQRPPMRNAVPRVPPPAVPVHTPVSVSLCRGLNGHLHADHGDKVMNMLQSSFIDEITAEGHRGHTVPVHKLGIKTGLPKCYEGEPDPMVFENWLSLLLGFFWIHQLDVLN